MTKRRAAPAGRPADAPCAIYLIRHAIAAERGDRWPDDHLRPLVRRGVSRMQQAVAGFRRLDAGIELVLTSPLARAQQTAEVVVLGLRPSPRLEQLAELSPGGSPDQVAAALAPLAGCRSLALIGHEPDLGRLAAWLVGAVEPFTLKKGGICRIDVDRLPPTGNGRLRWLATPKMLRALAGP